MPIHRRSAMKVRDGRVLKKNNWRLDPGGYRALPQDEIRLDRRRPPDGSRHLITIAELRRFIALLPDWDEVAIGLDAIVLDSATDCAGWCGPGVVAICAWPQDLWDWWSAEMAEEHRHILDLLDVKRVPIEESIEHHELLDEFVELGVRPRGRLGDLELRWTQPQARAYQLLHILPHELGHHHDRITTRGGAQHRARRALCRGLREPGARAGLGRLRTGVLCVTARLRAWWRLPWPPICGERRRPGRPSRLP